MTFERWKKVGELIVSKGWAKRSDLERCLEVARQTDRELGRVMLDLGVVSEENLRDALAEIFQLQTWERGESVEPLTEEESLLPFEFMRTNRIYPLSVEEGAFRFATFRPLEGWLREIIERRTGCRAVPVLATEKDILSSLEEAYAKSSPGEGSERSREAVEVSADIERLRDLASEAPVIRWVNSALTKALEIGASDLHIEPFEGVIRVRYRVDGVLREDEPLPIELYAAVVSRIKIISGLNIAERRLPQDGRNEIRVAGREADLRVSTLPTSYGEDVVIRILDRSKTTLDLDSLGMSEQVLHKFRSLIRRPYGLVLLTGPTGSGKTTTLFSALQEIRSPGIKIITIEDPIEYHLDGVNQIQVKPEIGLTFAAGLRSILRHDPDVILIGEIRDEETASIAVQSALTGHLVLSTLHTNDAPSAFSRLVDMGVKPYLVSSAVIGVMAQRLIRKICPHCKEEYVPEGALPPFLEDRDNKLYKGKGCRHCGWSGYRGRECVSELLVVTDPIRQAIMENRDAEHIRNVCYAQDKDYRSLWEDAMQKVKAGHTTLEEALREVGETLDGGKAI